ncbi:MAG: hypothetical protein ACOZF0_08395 [Thermodesulfobacteriota bacterium]
MIQNLAMETLVNMYMSDHLEQTNLSDNGGRRRDGDRRMFSYTSYIPERRSGVDRRSGEDRRSVPRLSVK